MSPQTELLPVCHQGDPAVRACLAVADWERGEDSLSLLFHNPVDKWQGQFFNTQALRAISLTPIPPEPAPLCFPVKEEAHSPRCCSLQGAGPALPLLYPWS